MCELEGDVAFEVDVSSPTLRNTDNNLIVRYIH